MSDIERRERAKGVSCDLYKGTAPDQRTLRAGVRSKRGAKAPHLTYLTFSQFAYWSRSRSHNRRIVLQGSSLQIDWRCRRPGDQGEMPLPSCAVNQLYFHPSIITSTCIKVQSTIKLSLASTYTTSPDSPYTTDGILGLRSSPLAPHSDR